MSRLNYNFYQHAGQGLSLGLCLLPYSPFVCVWCVGGELQTLTFHRHACVDPGFFVSGEGANGQKTAWTTFFSPQLILQFTEGVQWFITEKTILFQGFKGGPTFTRGVQLFPI